VQTGGHIELVNRAFLNTVAQFVPASAGVRVTGTWVFHTMGDFLQVSTRSDGVPQTGTGAYGENRAGLECFATSVSGTVNVNAWGTTATGATSSGNLGIGQDDKIIFEMTDDGSLVTCAFVNVSSGNRAKASATSSFAPATSYVTFHNHEYQTPVSFVAFADDFSIESGSANRPTHHYLFEEVSGATAYDLSGTADATLGTGAVRAAAIRGAGISFFGSSDGYVSLGIPGTSLGTADFTLAFWFNVPSTTRAIDMFGNQAYTGHSSFVQTRLATNGSVEFELDQDLSGTNNHVIISGSGGYDDGQWHHLAVLRQGTTLAMFIDGALSAANTRASGTATDLSAGTLLRIGSSLVASTLNQVTTGTFDDVRIYSTALSACDIARISTVP